MQTQIIDSIRQTPDGQEAERILRACVHCGFCTATCPTYQLLGDELDGPRGRIYQIKQVLEGGEITSTARSHLDRCLTCRSCESTCPSGVDYARLLDIGRNMLEETRGAGDTLIRKLMLSVLPYPERFAPAAKLGSLFAFLLPNKLKGKLPKPGRSESSWPTDTHSRKIAILSGCVQPTLAPGIDAAFASLLDRVGIEAIAVSNRCCGALPAHLSDEEKAEQLARETIDLLWPHVESGIEAIASTASGCGVTLKEYDWLLRHCDDYADKAAKISRLAADPVEIIEREIADFEEKPGSGKQIVFHPPCTLQHGMKLKDRVEPVLTALGYELLPFNDVHLCCGSAGTYSLFQPKISSALRDKKLAQLEQPQAKLIATANIGCMTHLAEISKLPVVHWLELVERDIRQ